MVLFAYIPVPFFCLLLLYAKPSYLSVKCSLGTRGKSWKQKIHSTHSLRVRIRYQYRIMPLLDFLGGLEKDSAIIHNPAFLQGSRMRLKR